MQAQETTVYRFYAEDQLVYLGVTNHVPGRLGAHAKRNWWTSCDRLTLAHYPTRAAALAVEREGIRTERPLYNIIYNIDALAVNAEGEPNMNIMSSREFQIRYQRLVEPVLVKAKWRTLGTWYPAGTEPGDATDLLDEIRHIKAELAKRPISSTVVSKPRTAVRAGVDRTRNNATFTPVPKP